MLETITEAINVVTVSVHDFDLNLERRQSVIVAHQPVE
jgi:hypothetical protein